MTAHPPLRRRTALLGALGMAGALAGCARPTPPTAPSSTPPSSGPPPSGPPPWPSAALVEARLAEIEARFGGRLGVAALDTATGATVGHRADELFLLCSTGKALTAGAILRRAQDDPTLLDRRIRYAPTQLVANSPVTTQHVADGLTVAGLCEAALTVSDNSAENLLLDQLGGPPAMTAFVRGLGDPVTRFDRPEPALNETAPGDVRDTTTPTWIARDLQAVALGTALAPAGRDRLLAWMTANTTGAAQIRAGVPTGWRVADKTGSGAQGESNDVGVVWPPGPETERSGARPSPRAPLVIAVYTAPADPRNTAGKATIAAATRAVVDASAG